LDLLLAPVDIVLGDLALLFEVLEMLVRIPANIADGDAVLLSLLVEQLDELFAPFLCELRDA
jgi:hypothetical protein